MERKSTLWQMPPQTREIAQLLNELERVSMALSKRLGDMAKLEQNAKAFEVLQRISPEDKEKLHLYAPNQIDLVQGETGTNLPPKQHQYTLESLERQREGGRKGGRAEKHFTPESKERQIAGAIKGGKHSHLRDLKIKEEF